VVMISVAAGPTGVRGQAASQSAENMQQMKMMMEQEMKSDKFKSSSSSRGYVFTLMPLYAVGVGVFALYQFLKVRLRNVVMLFSLWCVALTREEA